MNFRNRPQCGKGMLFVCSSCLFVFLGLYSVCFAQSGDVSQESQTGDVSQDYLAGRLEIGTRMVHRVLTDADSGHKGGTYGSGTYLGTIYALEEDQNYLPFKPYVAYFFTSFLGVELAYDQIDAETKAIDLGSEHVKTDGTVSLSGLTLSIIGRYENDTAFTPYAGIGLGFYSGDFDEDSDWAYTASTGRSRVMDVDSAVGFLLTLGCKWSLTENWFVDGSMQYVAVDPDATFHAYESTGVEYISMPGHFPMDNLAFRLGVGYSF